MASPGWGGLEKAFADLTNALAARCDVSALLPEGAAATEHLSGAVRSVGALPPGSRRNPLTLLRLSREIRGLQPDIVHSHAAKAAEMVHRATWASGRIHVATKHNTRSRRIFDRVDRATAVSGAVAATIRNPTGVKVVYNGIEPRAVAPRAKPDIFTIVSVGRLHPAKGFDVLIRQAARLRFPFRLEIAGEGRERSKLGALIAELGVGTHVELLGHRDDVPELLGRAHVQVVSSRSEGFSLALLEGLFYADALISTRVGIAPEVLPDDLLVDPESMADALTTLRDDYHGSVARFADVRARHADRFLLSRSADEYLALYEELLGSQ